MLEKERKYDYYMQLSSRMTSPQSSLHADGLPRANDPHAREKMLTESAAALEECYDIDRRYWNYRCYLENTFKKLEFRYYTALDFRYIENIRRPREKRINGIARNLGIKRSEVPALLAEAKKALAELLRAQGVPIEE